MNFKSLVIVTLFLFQLSFSFAQSEFCTLQGKVSDRKNNAIADAHLLLSPGEMEAISDNQGNYQFEHVPLGTYTLSLSHASYEGFTEKITLKREGVIEKMIVFRDTVILLQDMTVSGRKEIQEVSFLPPVKGTSIYAGKKTVSINLQTADANLAENNPRQMFAKVPGVMVWEMDGTGNQVSISTRGLVPHRSWELNVRQNGNVTNSDLFGYPESHYNPPAEAVERLEVVRGSGALQYGPQFGGMLNYVLKQADTTKKFSFETRQSAGSFGLFSSFNSIGGKVKKFSYYAYYNFRRSDGWRENSDYRFNAWHVNFGYDFSPNVRLSAEVSHMDYINHFAAGLTDSMFLENPRQSNRPRNYFNPTIYVPAVHLDIKAGKNTLITAAASAILGERNSVQFITVPTTDDTIDTLTNTYNPRQVDRDYYHSYSAEIRVRHDYGLFGNKSHLAAGVRYGDSRTLRRQKGTGTTGYDFDLSLIEDYKVDLTFHTVNYAGFVENVFNLGKRFSITPGLRFDYIHTEMTGEITAFTTTQVPFELQRQFPLFGVGAEYAITPDISAYANFTQAYRPVLHSDILPSSPLDRTDHDLKDAKGDNSEAGIRGTWKNTLIWDVNYFLLRYNNRIGTLIQTDSSGTYFYKTNIGDMLNQGVEAYIEFRPFSLLKNASRFLNIGFYTSTSYNAAFYKKGTVSSNGQNVDITGNVLENAPTWISRNGINYRIQSFSAAFQFSYVSQCFSDALNTVSSPNGVNGIVPSYFLLDFNCSYTLKEKYSFKLSLNNITNEYYYTRRATGYPGPGILPSDGRSFVVSIGAKI